MVLDDFFTLTEINNGLTVPSRVKELVAVMQKDGDSAVKNVSEAIRQWSAVATTVAATENRDCLDHFIHLDGLQYISKWLKDAQKFSNESNDSFLEESIIHLLQALGKLPVDYEKPVAAEIRTTVEDLLVHKSLKVKHKTRLLLETWKRRRDGDESLSDIEKVGALTDNDEGKGPSIGRHSESSQKDDYLTKETTCKELADGPTREVPKLSASSDVLHPCQVERTYNSEEVSDPSVRNDAPSSRVSSPSLPKPAIELPLCHSSVESCNPAISRQNTPDVHMECHELESASNLKDTPKIGSSPDKSESIEEFHTSEDGTFLASSDSGDATKSGTESSSQKLYVAGKKSSSDEGSLCIDSRKCESDGKCSMHDRGSADEYTNSNAFTTEEGGEYHKLCKSSSIEKSWENTKEIPALPSAIEDRGKIKNLGLHVCADSLANDNKFAKKEKGREPNRARNKSDVELYGLIDPLEVARQVAMEVEREIVGYREQSYSSSEKLPESNEPQPSSPGSVSGKQSDASEGSPKDVPSDPDLPMQEESATSTEDLDDEQTNNKRDMETSQVTEAAQKDNEEREPCNFDLNQEFCSEEADPSVNHLTGSVSIVSASRAAAPPGLPVAPLQFEGNLGWKGSAATSAFRPASPRKLPESEHDICTGGSSSNSRQQQRCLDIDLNVAEIPSCTGLLSGESSAERNAKHLNLDLNLASEDCAGPSDSRMGQFFAQANGQHDQSYSCSSSSKQPSSKNIDLNDQPSFLNASSDKSYLNKPSLNFNICGGIKSDESAISIMGTRVEVNRKDLVHPFLALPSGQTSEFAFDDNFARTGNFLGIESVLPYAHSSVYGYNNITPGPAMPFSSSIHGSGGPFPYMVDPRGAPVTPQMIGFSQTPFLINMMGPTNGVGAVVPSQSSFDLNSGSVVSGKRKEPENGWDQYPLQRYTPPWK